MLTSPHTTWTCVYPFFSEGHQSRSLTRNSHGDLLILTDDQNHRF